MTLSAPYCLLRALEHAATAGHLAVLVLVCAGFVGCAPPADDVGSSAAPPAETAARDTASDAAFFEPDDGFEFRHWNGMSGQLYFVEPVGSGGALADLDCDGDLDAVVVQGAWLDPKADEPARTRAAVAAGVSPGTRIFRNDLQHADEASGTSPQSRWVDVTDASRLRATGYGMGIATGDYDDDGRIDLYITSFGANQLWRNRGCDGTIAFENVTDLAGDGVGDSRWSTSAAFADIDSDGHLDLFVTNYVDFRLESHRPCRSAGGRPDYCGPQSYDGVTDRLLWNRGDGTFRDITGPAGLLEDPSSGLGVVAADFDRDGHLDLYVANDLRRNHLWRNLGLDADGVPHFENVGLERGVAVSMLGRAQASMGVVAGDLDEDGDDDLFMTHLTAETNTLYVNDGSGTFHDRSATSGLGAASLESTGFGTALVDIDRDGLLDIAIANGAVKVIEAQALAGDPYPLKQANQLFLNLGDGNFRDVSQMAGKAFQRLEVSRGLAVGDVDNDGDEDLLWTNNQGPATLLRSRSSGAWIGLRLLTSSGGRDALGAEVEITRPDGSVLHRRVATDGSYLSARDPRITLGLGPEVSATAEVRIQVRWLGGEVEIWPALEAGSYHTLVAGAGTPAG